MFKRLALSALTALSIAGPASAAPLQIFDGIWMFTPENSGADMPFFVDVVRQDREGDILLNVTDERDNLISHVWMSCDDDKISYGGEPWERVDHRKIEGWISDIACTGRVR